MSVKLDAEAVLSPRNSGGYTQLMTNTPAGQYGTIVDDALELLNTGRHSFHRVIEGDEHGLTKVILRESVYAEYQFTLGRDEQWRLTSALNVNGTYGSKDTDASGYLLHPASHLREIALLNTLVDG